MSYTSFKKLCTLIDPIVNVNADMSRRRTSKGPIITEIMLHCLLRWLAGGSYVDIRLCVGISVASFYVCLDKCMKAILQIEELSYSFPKTEDLHNRSNEFQALSTNGAMKGCVACVDGFLLRIQVPASTETGNVKAYFSGHYSAYGINVQAACDHKCRFVYVCVAAPGSTNNISAFKKTRLHKIVEHFHQGFFVAGDNAYPCSEHLLTPFSAGEKLAPEKDAYNFYLS